MPSQAAKASWNPYSTRLQNTSKYFLKPVTRPYPMSAHAAGRSSFPPLGAANVDTRASKERFRMRLRSWAQTSKGCLPDSPHLTICSTSQGFPPCWRAGLWAYTTCSQWQLSGRSIDNTLYPTLEMESRVLNTLGTHTIAVNLPGPPGPLTLEPSGVTNYPNKISNIPIPNYYFF